MNGDSQAIPIHEIEVPMLRLFRRTWTVTPRRDGDVRQRGQFTDIPGEVSAEGHRLR